LAGRLPATGRKPPAIAALAREVNARDRPPESAVMPTGLPAGHSAGQARRRPVSLPAHRLG
jgi:hypothetical protein